MKTCSKCKIEKELSEFYKDSRRKDQHTIYCNECYKKIDNLKYKNTSTQRKEYQKNYRKDNKFSSYKSNAKQRGYPFELSLEQFDNIIKQPCHYCGKEGLNGIDRKDNTQGYILDNCLPCCSRCNKVKSNYPYDDFINWIKKTYKHLKENQYVKKT